MLLIFKMKFPLATSLVLSHTTPSVGFVSPVTTLIELLLPAPLCPSKTLCPKLHLKERVTIDVCTSKSD